MRAPLWGDGSPVAQPQRFDADVPASAVPSSAAVPSAAVPSAAVPSSAVLPREGTHDERALLVRAGGRTCGLVLKQVGETMRPLPIHGLRDTPEFVLGFSIIRGNATPVVNLARLLGGPQAPAEDAQRDVGRRFVTVRTEEGSVALAVDEVGGVVSLTALQLEAVPTLVTGMQSGVVDRVGQLDGGLLLVLRSARLLEDDIWQQLATASPA
jgi:purine-binding chemotaxis protein CheW